MKYNDLRDFIDQLPVDPNLEMTEICDRTLRAQGPALLFENPVGYSVPVLANLFGTPKRVALGMGESSVEALREVGKLLAMLKEPEPPKSMKDAWDKLPMFKQVLNMSPKVIKKAPCQQQQLTGDDIDLGNYPIQTCWPGDAGPLVTWLSHRGGALDFREWQQQNPGQPYPVAVALGADPATILGAVTPVPDTLSEYAFAGLLRGGKTEVAKCIDNDLQVPASAEIILEGFIYPGDMARGVYLPRRYGRRRPLWRSHRLL